MKDDFDLEIELTWQLKVRSLDHYSLDEAIQKHIINEITNSDSTLCNDRLPDVQDEMTRLTEKGHKFMYKSKGRIGTCLF